MASQLKGYAPAGNINTAARRAKLPRAYFADAPSAGSEDPAVVKVDTGEMVAGVGPSSAPALLSHSDRDRLARLRTIFRP